MRSRIIVAVEKQYYIFVCVRVYVHVALLIQYTTRMRHIVTPVGPLVLPYFSTLSHKRYDFRKEVMEHKMCILIFLTTFV